MVQINVFFEWFYQWNMFNNEYLKMAFWPWTDPPPGETKSLKSLPTCSRSCVRRRWVAALCGAGRPRDNLSIHLGMGVGWDEEQALLWACADEEDIDKVSSREQNYAWWHHLCRSTCIYGAGANFLDALVKPVRPPSCSPSLPLSLPKVSIHLHHHSLLFH